MINIDTHSIFKEHSWWELLSGCFHTLELAVTNGLELRNKTKPTKSKRTKYSE